MDLKKLSKITDSVDEPNFYTDDILDLPLLVTHLTGKTLDKGSVSIEVEGKAIKCKKEGNDFHISVDGNSKVFKDILVDDDSIDGDLVIDFLDKHM